MRDSVLFEGTNPHSHRGEGDVWEEGGKTWTIRGGIKQTVARMDGLRKYFATPLVCPCCGKGMNHYLDEQMWTTHRKCFNCVVDDDHKIMKAGHWEQYQHDKIEANATAFLEDLRMTIQEFISDTGTKSQVTEDGMVERWADPSQEFLKEKGKEVLDHVTNVVKNIKQR